ncbi:MAG: hypothetical protein HKN11_04645 [Rhizobiales bacterium]|nr:hypothetical protein [Hyphomicrobiales bacterium]
MACDQDTTNYPGTKRRWPRIVILLLIYGGLLVFSQWGGDWLAGLVGTDLGPEAQSHARHLVMASMAIYTALMAMPFVPGMEISLALFAAFGSQVAVFVYFATVAALSLTFVIGRLVPIRLLASLFGSLGLHRSEALVNKLAPLDRQQRLEALIANAPRRFVPWLVKHRYIAIIVALNLPGNALIGGGGGIALLAGISGLFTFPGYLAALALAVLPVPLFVTLMGYWQ